MLMTNTTSFPFLDFIDGKGPLNPLLEWVCRRIIESVPRENYTFEYEFCKEYLGDRVTPITPDDQELPVWAATTLTVLYIIIIIIAFLGNACVVLIYIRNRSVRSVNNLFLLSLALSDLCITFFCMPINLSYIRNLSWHLGSFGCKAVPFIQNVSVTVNSLTLVCIAYDRYLAILHPLKVKNFQSMAVATGIVYLIWILGVAISLPSIWYFNLIKINIPTDKPPQMYGLSFCMRPESVKVRLEIYRWCMLVILFVTPLCTMMFCYIRIGHRLWSRVTIGAQIRQMEEHRNRVNRRVIMMLLLVSLLYFFCWAPTWIFEMVAFRALLRATSANLTVRCFLIWLAMSNSCYNPLIYTFLHEKFRKAFVPTFSCRRRKVHPVGRVVGPNTLSQTEATPNTESSTLKESKEIFHKP